ncbi:glycoside hydrolase family 19, partial [Acinetobacter baumannii]|nr:glycoside hydrolase family 19 [Acinetobacter baumannii]
VLVLTSNDTFVLKSSINSANGSSQPVLIKLDEPYEKFKSASTIKILDRDGSDYIVEKTNVEMLVVENGKKQLFSISNGKLSLQSMIGQKLEFTVYKPDG